MGPGGRAWLAAAKALTACAACLLGVWLAARALVDARSWQTPRPVDHPAGWVGRPAPDFVLKDLEGRAFHLRDRLGRVPVVLEFVSFT